MGYKVIIMPPAKRRLDDTVIVDGMFHELQDYEGIFCCPSREGISL